MMINERDERSEQWPDSALLAPARDPAYSSTWGRPHDAAKESFTPRLPTSKSSSDHEPRALTAFSPTQQNSYHLSPRRSTLSLDLLLPPSSVLDVPRAASAPGAISRYIAQSQAPRIKSPIGNGNLLKAFASPYPVDSHFAPSADPSASNLSGDVIPDPAMTAPGKTTSRYQPGNLHSAGWGLGAGESHIRGDERTFPRPGSANAPFFKHEPHSGDSRTYEAPRKLSSQQASHGSQQSSFPSYYPQSTNHAYTSSMPMNGTGQHGDSRYQPQRHHEQQYAPQSAQDRAPSSYTSYRIPPSFSLNSHPQDQRDSSGPPPRLSITFGSRDGGDRTSALCSCPHPHTAPSNVLNSAASYSSHRPDSAPSSSGYPGHQYLPPAQHHHLRPETDTAPVKFRPGLDPERNGVARERRFACADCPKRFLRRQDLSRHAATHLNGFKPFRCTYCGTGFTRQDALHRHGKAKRCAIQRNMNVVEPASEQNAPSPLPPHGGSQDYEESHRRYRESQPDSRFPPSPYATMSYGHGGDRSDPYAREQ